MDASEDDIGCAGCRRWGAEVASLKERIVQLERLLEAAQRGGKRQAAPFRKRDEPAAEPKPPGRKSGDAHGEHLHRAAPKTIDERHDAPLPAHCPHCHGQRLEETHVDQQYQTDIVRRAVHRQFDIHVGCCRDCGRTARGRHALQTSDATGAAASQLGPDAHAAITLLNKQAGLPYGKIQRLFHDLFGITLNRSSACRSVLRTARRCEPTYADIRADIRGSPWLVPDETGWRVGGRGRWLHVFAGPTSTCYDIGDRSAAIAEKLLARDWSGTLIHDGYSVYDQFTRAMHQQCLQHLQRRCRSLLETAHGMAARLPRQVLAWIDEAFAVRRLWRAGELTDDDSAVAALQLGCELETLAAGRFTHQPNRRLARHILHHATQWFWFLIDPTIDATNFRAEQAIRPAVVNRKVWGGNRTPAGAHAQSVLSSVLATLHQRAAQAMHWLSHSLCRPRPLSLPSPGR